jgi:drug/metabolite transporter (DMT)-like permease
VTAFALSLVLLAALTHATWNYFAKSAVASRHFVWLYSLGSTILYAPIVAWILIAERPEFTKQHWLALGATSVLHLGYSLVLQAGYRASDLSLVYPIARGTGPLLSFIGASIFLGEQPTALSILGLGFIVAGILLVAGLTREPHKAPRAGVAYGLLTGTFIAAYTVNDGWAVKVLLISPFLLDFTGNFVRMLVLTPLAWRDRARAAYEARAFATPVAVVSVFGPLGYVLVLFAMRMAPVSHVAPARELATLVGAYLGSRLLKEQSGPRRIVGAACIVAGVISLVFAPAE